MWYISPLQESTRRVKCKAGCAKYIWFTFLGNCTAENTFPILELKLEYLKTLVISVGLFSKRKVSPTL